MSNTVCPICNGIGKSEEGDIILLCTICNGTGSIVSLSLGEVQNFTPRKEIRDRYADITKDRIDYHGGR